MNEAKNQEVEVLPSKETMVDLVASTEYDVQISTAKKYPRSVKQFISDATTLATLNEQVADDCIYALPRGGKTIEGASIRFAEIVLTAWGNLRVGSRVVREDARSITAQGICHDLQNNALATFEVTRRIVDSKGKRYNDDMIIMTGNAACSIALRNAILKVVPKALWNPIYEQARKVIVGDAKTLVNRRTEAMKILASFGITEPMILAKFQVKGIDDITVDHLPTMKGFATAIRDNETTVEELFAEYFKAEQQKHIAAAGKGDTKKIEVVDPKTGEITEQTTQPITDASTDWRDFIEQMAETLEQCKTVVEVNTWREDHAADIAKVAEKAPKDIQKLWTGVWSAKTAEFAEKKK